MHDNLSRFPRLTGAGFLLSLIGATSAAVSADDAPPAAAPSAAKAPAAAPPASQGLVPIPDFAADFWDRDRLTGDWGGSRTDWANKGIQLDINFTQTMQSVVDGGSQTGTRYGGSLDYVMTLDLMRMGVMPGALIKFRGETRYGEAANDIAGSLLPVNTDGFFPLKAPIDDEIPFTLTNLTYYQFLSEHFGVVVGKVDTLDGDPNEFASGRGVSQFMNGSLVFPTSPLVAMPAYSTLGAGIIVMPTKNITISSVVLNATDSSTTSGFDDFGEGTAWLTEAQFQYRLGDLPGGANVGFLYGFDNTFLNLNGRLIFEPGQGLVPPTTDDSWAAYWSLWQYLFVESPSDALINTTNGIQDHQGVGVFLRMGFADDDTTPLDFSISGGVGAKGIIPGRDNDTCGIGYYYYSLETARLVERINIEDHAQGFEAYYNLAITPAARLTFDIQVVESARAAIDTATILGVRLNLAF